MYEEWQPVLRISRNPGKSAAYAQIRHKHTLIMILYITFWLFSRDFRKNLSDLPRGVIAGTFLGKHTPQNARFPAAAAFRRSRPLPQKRPHGCHADRGSRKVSCSDFRPALFRSDRLPMHSLFPSQHAVRAGCVLQRADAKRLSRGGTKKLKKALDKRKTLCYND